MQINSIRTLQSQNKPAFAAKAGIKTEQPEVLKKCIQTILEAKEQPIVTHYVKDEKVLTLFTKGDDLMAKIMIGLAKLGKLTRNEDETAARLIEAGARAAIFRAKE